MGHVSLQPIRIKVTETTQVGETRRAAAVLSSTLGFSETARGKIAIVINEAANNLVRHGRGGHMILIPCERDGCLGLDILALDKGPGMADLGRSMRDGYSTGGTAGNGLGAMERQSDMFQIHSAEDVGTAVLSRFWVTPPKAPKPGERRLSIGAVCLPKRGEEVCGDGWSVDRRRNGDYAFLLVDGLGHGASAAESMRDALSAAESLYGKDLPPEQILEHVHLTLKKNRGRGAAVGLALVSPSREVVEFSGIGNVAGVIQGPAGRTSMVSMNGTVGATGARRKTFQYPWSAESMMILHSDGLTGHWGLEGYAGLRQRDPALIAGVLFRDFERERDDATVLVAREE